MGWDGVRGEEMGWGDESRCDGMGWDERSGMGCDETRRDEMGGEEMRDERSSVRERSADLGESIVARAPSASNCTAAPWAVTMVSTAVTAAVATSSD
jgi:hypothetical protein